MRIALANWSRGRIGGVETYLCNVARALAADGHRVALLYEIDGPLGNGSIDNDDPEAIWSVAALGAKEALSRLERWAPDVVLERFIDNPDLEEQLAVRWPAVIFPGGYNGVCISATKSFRVPTPRPCGRAFGPLCMAYYFPRRCGGLSPLTMVRNYLIALRRLSNLKRFRAILVASQHMRREFLRQGIPAERLQIVPHAVANVMKTGATSVSPREAGPLRLLFVGRLTTLKGGRLMIEATARATSALGRPLQLTLAGDGPERARLEGQAARVMAVNPGVRIEFAGWLDRRHLDFLSDRADLLVVPSLWPEPFGLVGPEAGLRGVPAAAFAVGGIPEWLRDGVGGHLAPGDPPTAAGLADAIIRCLADPTHYARLRQGAVEVALEFTMKHHLQLLLPILRLAADGNSAVT